MSQQEPRSKFSQRLAKVIALSVSLSLAFILIIQAQRDVGDVVAQDRPQAHTDQASTTSAKADALNTALFDHPNGLLDHDYAVELVPEPAERQAPQQAQQRAPQKLKLHKTNTAQVRYLKYQVVKRLEELRDQAEVAGLTARDLSALKKLGDEIKRKTRTIRSRFAHTSKSMAPRPIRSAQPIPVDPQTLAALKKLIELKR